MIFRNYFHFEQWTEAVKAAGALRDDGTVSSYYGASLFIITGIPGFYSRAKQYIYNNWIDFEAILNMGLSTGENILVSLAGNLYNGSFFDEYKPLDIIEKLDADTVELVARAFVLRKQRIDMNTIFD